MPSKKKWKWKPKVTFADPPWDEGEKTNELIEVLLTGRFPLVELQDYLSVAPTASEKDSAGKYGHVKGVTWLIQSARLQGWPVMVTPIKGETWVWLPQHVMDEELDKSEANR